LSGHLTAAEKNRFDFQAILIEQSHFPGNPDVALAKAERGIADLDALEGLGIGDGRE